MNTALVKMFKELGLDIQETTNAERRMESLRKNLDSFPQVDRLVPLEQRAMLVDLVDHTRDQMLLAIGTTLVNAGDQLSPTAKSVGAVMAMKAYHVTAEEVVQALSAFLAVQTVQSMEGPNEVFDALRELLNSDGDLMPHAGQDEERRAELNAKFAAGELEIKRGDEALEVLNRGGMCDCPPCTEVRQLIEAGGGVADLGDNEVFVVHPDELPGTLQ